MSGWQFNSYCGVCFHWLSPSSNVYKVSKAEDSSFSLFLSLSFLLPFFPPVLFLPCPSQLAALNGGHWEVRPRPPHPLSTLAPLSPWPRKNTTCTALAVFYLSSSPLHVGLTSKSWRSWMRTLAGDLPIIWSFKKQWKKRTILPAILVSTLSYLMYSRK